MLEDMSFEEYYESISDENFSEAERSSAQKLWELLHNAEPFNQDEQEKAEGFVIDGEIDGLLRYSEACGHMDEKSFDALNDFLCDIQEDPQNGFLLDMIIEYFTEL